MPQNILTKQCRGWFQNVCSCRSLVPIFRDLQRFCTQFVLHVWVEEISLCSNFFTSWELKLCYSCWRLYEMEYWMWFPYLHLITWQLKISACCWMVVVRWTYNSWRATLVLTTRLEVWNERDDVTSYHNMFVMLFVAMLSWCDVMEYKVMSWGLIWRRSTPCGAKSYDMIYDVTPCGFMSHTWFHEMGDIWK